MSWQLTAGSLVRLLDNWQNLAEETRWATRMFLLEMSDHRSWEMEHHAVLRTKGDKKTSHFCWGCGETDPSNNSLWIRNSHHMYSDRLCPSCQDHEYTAKIFRNEIYAKDLIANHIADLGANALPQFRDREAGWAIDCSETEKEGLAKAKEKIKQQVLEVIGDGDPYGATPTKLK